MQPSCPQVYTMFQQASQTEPPRSFKMQTSWPKSSTSPPEGIRLIWMMILLAICLLCLDAAAATTTTASLDNHRQWASDEQPFAFLGRQNKQTDKLLQRLEQQKLPYQVLYLERSLPLNRERRHLTARPGQVNGTTAARSNQVVGHYNRTNVVIKAFNYKFRLDLELNNNLFGPSLIQKHFLPKGGQQISTQRLEHCYYHARSQLDTRPLAIGAFRTCNGLSGIIHANNESFVIHPFYDADLSKKHPHIIYRYQTVGSNGGPNNPLGPDYDEPAASEQVSSVPTKSRECGNTKLHEWALRQYNKLSPDEPASFVDRQAHQSPVGKRATQELHCDTCNHNQEDESLKRLSKRDVSLTEKYIELALILSQDVFDKRNASSRLEVLHDAIQIVNLLDLYFRSANTRVALIYIETWQYGDQIELSTDVKQTLYNFLEYSTRKLYKVSMDAVHLLTGGSRPFDSNQVGMSIPDSICSSRAVSVSQEASLFEPFIAASTMAHMLGHNLGMEHDSYMATGGSQQPVAATSSTPGSRVHSTFETPSVAARHRPSVPAQGHGGEGEEHEDEVKSRSVNQERTWQAPHKSTSNGPRWNCIMSERFIYPQPPISIGNMIQQQVASSANASGHLVSVFNTADTGSSSEPPMNGPTMNQIDDELQMMAKESQFLASLPFRFSQQSIDTFHRLLRLGHGICLFNKPNQLEDFKTCGNGIVDKGEDCDCGTFQECLESDSCCDPITCKFKADAECINGACCDRCKLRRRGFVCRRARSECDLSEQCDGKSAQCAPDVYKANGQQCASGQGHCFQGRCPTHDQQCADLWGSDARQSDRLCYLGFNSNGTIRGNCGLATAPRQFKRCEAEHVMCGTLQCQLGDMKPLSASLGLEQKPEEAKSFAEFSKKIIHSQDGQHHECKVITGQSASPSGSSISYVLDGTRCATNKVCFNRTCQSVATVYREAYELCPRDERERHCSGNGVCSTANRCQCDEQWTGHDCSQRVSPSTELPTEQTIRHIETLKVEPVPVSTSLPATLASDVTEPPTVPTTTPAQITTSTTTPAPPAPVSSSSNVVLDKKKHDAMGAPTLVFILVSIVAAVYLGFALMANCYRRKGFIKPDKVLRHHQMNCKLDALRSSFIAKRLADAQAAGSIANLTMPEAHDSSQGPLSGDLMRGAFLSPNLQQAPLAATCQHLSAIYSPAGIATDGHPMGYDPEVALLKSQFAHYDEEGPQQQHPATRQVAASVHYFDELDARDCIHQRRHAPMYQADNLGSFERLADQSDHIPLLSTNIDKQPGRFGRRVSGQQSMSSFRQPLRSQPSIRQRAHQPHEATWHFSGRPTCLTLGKLTSRLDNGPPLINRATSLGSVNQKLQANSRRHYEDESEQQADAFEADEDARRAHRALATPLRTSTIGRRSGQQSKSSYYQQRRHQTEPLDSCSAPSSPDHKDPWTSDPDEQVYHPPLVRQISSSRLGARQGQSSRSFQNRDDDVDELPPLPPPPLEPEDELEVCARGDTEETEDESDLISSPHRAARQQSGGAKSAWSTSRSVHRVPLNSGESHKSPMEQLSLIAQLQQLEQVQSLHQKGRQADQGQKGNKSLPANESLHEFFSLPLSVQLSALLARSFAPDQRADTMAVDDYLNLLNNTGVAASSRRNFRRPGQPKMEQPTTSHQQQRKQQVKLQNLQGLIDRLQKLQQQTMLQQQLEELGATDDLLLADAQQSRNSTLNRPKSQMRSNQTAGDLATLASSNRAAGDSATLLSRSMMSAGGQSSTRSLRPTSSRSTREQLAESKNDSVFSMSDSEDGAYVSRMLVSTYQNLQARKHESSVIKSTQHQQEMNNPSDRQTQPPNQVQLTKKEPTSEPVQNAQQPKQEPNSNSTIATSSVSGSSSASSASTAANDAQHCNTNQ